MDDIYFVYNGVDSRDMGVRLQSPVEIGAARPNTETITIPGKNAALTYWDGSYANRDVTARCFALEQGVSSHLAEIQKWLLMDFGYHRFEIPEEPDIYMLAQVANGGDIEIFQNVLAPFRIQFDCSPQKFLKFGELPISVSNGDAIINEWFPSKPLIRIRGGGSGTLQVGTTTVALKNLRGTLTLDCETQNAQDNLDQSNPNSQVSALEFPTLPHGKTKISWYGDNLAILSVEITPRWWHL